MLKGFFIFKATGVTSSCVYTSSATSFRSLGCYATFKSFRLTISSTATTKELNTARGKPSLRISREQEISSIPAHRKSVQKIHLEGEKLYKHREGSILTKEGKKMKVDYECRRSIHKVQVKKGPKKLWPLLEIVKQKNVDIERWNTLPHHVMILLR